MSLPSRRAGWLLAIAACVLPLLYAWFTQHVWEDYYITLRSSRNLVLGHGLVFQPGEKLHTFTSPLGVLLPAACLWVTGANETAALWLFRLLSAAALAGGLALLWRRVAALGLGPLGQFVLFGLLLCDAKTTDFSTNGQETALLVFFALLLWTELARTEVPRAGWLAAAYAGLMWTRPDAFVLATAISVPYLLWRAPSAGVPWGALVRGVLLGGLLYVPWFAWAWWYYGTPVPHTVMAKSHIGTPLQITDFVLMPLRTLTGQPMLDYLFMPANFHFGGWPRDLRNVAHLLTVVAAFGWLLPGQSTPGRRASLAVFIGNFYLGAIVLYSWYVPPWTALGAIALAFAADSAYRACQAAGRTQVAAALRIGALVVVLLQAAVLAAAAWQMRVQQRLIEDGGRHQIGLWLRQNAAAGDTVFLEPLGYIGYFSQLKTHDFPGLSSAEVLATVRRGAQRYSDIVRELRPTWLVLRPQEIGREGFSSTEEIPGYREVRRWNAQPALDAERFLPGRGWLEFDAQFILYRRL